jgi:NAD(P)-dependent dehydrogenase (short-subunit alcohol dehydrogenase family)
MGRLDSKVAVITGATSGMGRATAIRFAGEGAAVVVADLNEEGGASTVRQCKENGGRAVFQKADVAAESDIEALIARAVSEFGRLDVTFNNAGLIGGSARWKTSAPKVGTAPTRFFCAASSSASSIRSQRCAKRAAARSSRLLRSPGCAEALVPRFTVLPRQV